MILHQYLITAMLDFAVMIYALQSRAKASNAAALLAFSLGLWSIELFLLSYIKNLNILYPVFHLTRWGMFLAPTAFSFFYLALLGEEGKSYKKYVVLPSLIFSVTICFFNAFVFDTELRSVTGGYMPVIDWSYYVFVCLMVATMVFTVASSFFTLRDSAKRDMQRLVWMILIGVLFVVASIATIMFIFSSGYLSKYVGSIVNLLFVAIIFYVIKPKLLIDFRRAVVVILANLFAISLFSVINLIVVSEVLSVSVTYALAVTCSTVIAVMLLAYPPLVRGLTTLGELTVAKGTYDSAFELLMLEKKIESSRSVSDLELQLRSYLVDRIGLNKVGFFILSQKKSVSGLDQISSSNSRLFDFASKSPSLFLADEVGPEELKYMQTLGYEAVIPIFSSGRCLGYVGLGRSLMREYYRSEDLLLFDWLEGSLGEIVERLDRYECFEEELSDARKTLSVLNVMNQYHHDIKTPLAVIDGVVSTDLYDKDRQREIVIEQVERGTKLIASMAGLLKGRRERKSEKIDLSYLLEESVDLFRNRFESISLQVESGIQVVGDVFDLKILFANIVKNAMEAGDPGRALTLAVATSSCEQGIQVLIEDTGMGMCADRLRNLWSSIESSKPMGNAIGLQTIKRIAEEHSAVISVDSEMGRGTRFEISFPVAAGLD